MNQELDNKILDLISYYSEYLDTEEPNFRKQNAQNKLWIIENLLDTARLHKLSDNQYIETFRDIYNHINPTSRNWKKDNSAVLSQRAEFTQAVIHLNETTHKHRFDVINDLTGSGSFKIKNLDVGFWTEIIRCKFDDIPVVNNRTRQFFSIIGIDIGKTVESNIREVGAYYLHWVKLFNEGKKLNLMTLSEMSHLEWYAETQDVGKFYMINRFGAKL